MGQNSTLLFAMPSFVEGIARIMDFGNMLTMYNISPTPEAADRRAAALDWHAVGNDLRVAMRQFETEHRPARDRVLKTQP